MKKYLTITVLLACLLLQAQNNNTAIKNDFDSVYVSKLTGEVFYDFIEFAGNQFLTTDWVKGDILLSNGLMIKNEKIKYNGFNDELYWLNESNLKKFKIDKLSVSEFWLKNVDKIPIHFKKININKNPEIKFNNGFVEVIVEGKYSLYIQHKIVSVGEEESFISGKYYLLPLLKHKPVYILKLPGGVFASSRTISKSFIIKNIPEYKKEISKYLKENSIILKEKDDVLTFINYINGL